MTTFAEQFGLARRGTCWCCGGIGLCTDDWDVVQRCMFCDGTGVEAGGDGEPEAAAALRQALGEFEGTDEG